MIKINRLPTPPELTEEKKEELTNEYKQDPKKSVWNQPYIKNTLLKMSHNKCFYCEKKYNDPGDLNIEHFYPKKLYPDEVVNWNNLLLACSRCNRHKGMLDTRQHRIVNPTVDDPKEYIYLTANYFLKGYDSEGIGAFTIKQLFGNNIWDMVSEFVQIYSQYIGKDLNSLSDKFKEQQTHHYSDQLVNKLIDKLIAIFKYAQPDQKYSAVISTLILNDENFEYLYNLIVEHDWWDQELKGLYQTSKNIALKYK